MFYEVKVVDSRGQLKKVVSSKKLSNRFWRDNESKPSYYEEGSRSEELSEKGNLKADRVGVESSL